MFGGDILCEFFILLFFHCNLGGWISFVVCDLDVSLKPFFVHLKSDSI